MENLKEGTDKALSQEPKKYVLFGILSVLLIFPDFLLSTMWYGHDASYSTYISIVVSVLGIGLGDTSRTGLGKVGIILNIFWLLYAIFASVVRFSF
jgi:hypothetical protein